MKHGDYAMLCANIFLAAGFIIADLKVWTFVFGLLYICLGIYFKLTEDGTGATIDPNKVK